MKILYSPENFSLIKLEKRILRGIKHECSKILVTFFRMEYSVLYHFEADLKTGIITSCDGTVGRYIHILNKKKRRKNQRIG